MSAEHIWNDLRQQHERPVFRRVDDTHPYDIYLGIDATETPVLMLLYSTPVERLPHLRSLQVSQHLRQDGRFALLVSLESSDLLHPFRYVCDDLIETLRAFTNRGAEAAFLLQRLEKWRRLLETGKIGLSKCELLGLVGELLFLEEVIGRAGCAPAVDGLLGPSGAPQDFQNGGRLYEVKASAIGAHTVTISSLEQLHTGGAVITLIVYFIGSSTAKESGAFTPNELVRRIRSLLDSSSTAASSFESKLAEVGFDEKQTDCDSPLIMDKRRNFEVRESFPRLTPASVPSAIPAVSYCLDLDQCTGFEISTSEVLADEP